MAPGHAASVLLCLRDLAEAGFDGGTAVHALVDTGTDVAVTVQFWNNAKRDGEFPSPPAAGFITRIFDPPYDLW